MICCPMCCRLRVLRLLRLVQYWKGVYKIFACLVAARGQVLNIFILLFVFMTCFALIGMQVRVHEQPPHAIFLMTHSSPLSVSSR